MDGSVTCDKCVFALRVLHDFGLSSLYSDAEVLCVVGLLQTNALYQPHNVQYPTFSFHSNISYADVKDNIMSH